MWWARKKLARNKTTIAVNDKPCASSTHLLPYFIKKQIFKMVLSTLRKFFILRIFDAMIDRSTHSDNYLLYLHLSGKEAKLKHTKTKFLFTWPEQINQCSNNNAAKTQKNKNSRLILQKEILKIEQWKQKYIPSLIESCLADLQFNASLGLIVHLYIKPKFP